MKKLPSTIYVTLEGVGTRDEFLAVNESLEGCAEIGVRKRVGRYELKETHEVIAEPMIVDPKGSRKAR